MSDRHHQDSSDSKQTRATTSSTATDVVAGRPDTGVDDAWERVTSRMRQDIGDAAWRNWIKPLRVSRLEDGTLTLEASSTLACERVTNQYADRLRVISAAEYGTVKKVEISLATQQAPRMSQQRGAAARRRRPAKRLVPASTRVTHSRILSSASRTNWRSPWRAARRSATVAFNPLFLYGGVGLGKTHLMHAIAWHIREQDPSRNVVYLSAEKFMYRFVQALRFRDTMSFKEQFRSVDVLMIDDVQFISGKDSTQEEFFHTFNALVEDGRQVIVSADKSPTDLEGLEERLRSRLGWGMVADIHPADYELRLGILQAKAERARIPVPDKVLEFLAHRISSNVRELEGALTRIAAHASLVGREISIDSAAELLSDLLRASSRQITIDEIQKRVAAHYDVRIAEMFSARRARNIARPRQVAMYLAKMLTAFSYPEIGRQFGGRDHTTVMHAVRTIEGLIASDKGIAEDVQLLRSLLSN